MRPLPLQGRHIVVTRAREQAGELIARLESLGATVASLPTIALAPPLDFHPLDAALRGLAAYHGFLFTSTNGVHGFFDRARELGLASQPPAGSWVGAIGPATAAALADHAGWKPSIIPAHHHAEGMAAALAALDLTGQKILIPRAAVGHELLPEELQRRGAAVTIAATYRIMAPLEAQEQAAQLFPALEPGHAPYADTVVFTSSSTARNLIEMLGGDYRARLQGVALAAIGPATRQTIEALGLQVAVEAPEATTEALAHSILQYWHARTP